MSVFKGVLAGIALAGIAFSANAALIYSPVAATASSEFGPMFGIDNTIDQSGLSDGFTSGVDDFDTFLALDPTHSFLPDTEWFTQAGVTTATVVYDLGAIRNVFRLALWNEEVAGFASAQMSTSVDGVTFTPLTTIMPADNPISVDYPAQVFDTAFNGRFFKLDIDDCPQPEANGAPNVFNGCAIGEVAVDAAIPLPASLLLLGTGVAAMAGFKHRFGKKSI